MEAPLPCNQLTVQFVAMVKIAELSRCCNDPPPQPELCCDKNRDIEFQMQACGLLQSTAGNTSNNIVQKYVDEIFSI